MTRSATETCNKHTAAAANTSPAAAAANTMFKLTTSAGHELSMREVQPSCGLEGGIVINGDNGVALGNGLDTATESSCNKLAAANPSLSFAVNGKTMVGHELLATEAGARPSSSCVFGNVIFALRNIIFALRNVSSRFLAIRFFFEHTPAAPSVEAGERIITLTSMNGQKFLLKESGARLSSHIAGVIRNGRNVVPLHSISARELDTITTYCNKHGPIAHPSLGSSTADQEQMEEWDRELVRGHGDVDAIYNLLVASYFLRVQGLINAICDEVYMMIQRCDNDPEKLRETFRLGETIRLA